MMNFDLRMQRLVAEGRSVLVSAYTNSALDNVLLKVVSRGQSQLLRLGRTSSVHPDIKPYLPRVPAGNDPVAATALRKHVRSSSLTIHTLFPMSLCACC